MKEVENFLQGVSSRDVLQGCVGCPLGMSYKGVWGVLMGCPTRVCGVSSRDVLQECVGCPHGMYYKSVWGVLTGCPTRVCGGVLHSALSEDTLSK
jgi:hypothetical protein